MNDHDILHYFAQHPEAATTQHPIVKNDKYGLKHTLVYSQEVLTPEQIKDAHDNWVSRHEPNGHTTPIEGPTVKEVEYVQRWDQPLIENPATGLILTKRDIFRYYASPKVKNKIYNQIKDTPAVVRQTMSSKEEGWLKRPTITSNRNDVNNPQDLEYYIERRNIEFHPTMKEITDKLVIDLDPGEELSLEDVKKVALYLEKFLENQTFIKDVEFQFSGNRGFYVWGYLTSPQNINELREKLKALLQPISEMNGIKVTLRESPGKKTVRLDLSPMKNTGSVKAEGSLDYRTGYISTKLAPNQLRFFDPKKDAVVDKSSLKPTYSFKDETLV